MPDKPTARRRAGAKWFKERLSFSEVGALPSKPEKADALLRHVEELEKLMSGSSKKRPQDVAALAALKKQLMAESKKPKEPSPGSKK